MQRPDFGDTVRIRTTPETLALGYADQVGTCFGFTTPSVTGIEVVGPALEDHALAVGFGEGPAVWFDPSLVVFIDVNAGQVARVGDTTFVRAATGEWIEGSNSDAQPADE